MPEIPAHTLSVHDNRHLADGTVTARCSCGWTAETVDTQAAFEAHDAHVGAGIPDLVSVNCIAARCGVSRHTAHRWHTDRGLPAPDTVIDGKPLWLWATVARWLDATGRTAVEA